MQTLLIEQFNGLVNGPNWIGVSFRSVTRGLHASLAFQQPPGKRHSMAAIIQHMMAWKNFGLRQLQGDEKAGVSQAASFRLKPYAAADEQAWQQLLQDYHAIHSDLMEVLATTTPGRLQQKAGSRDYTLEYLVNGLLLHDSYHIGQLALIKKQLKQLSPGLV
jgi:uncharacterized damage-inducible protein DinB